MEIFPFFVLIFTKDLFRERKEGRKGGGGGDRETDIDVREKHPSVARARMEIC